jgi:hypothetical protein
MRRAFWISLVLLPVGCGGGGVGTITPSAPVSVVDGVTGAAIPGAAVNARPGDSVTVERPGYLRRDTIVARDGVISLWPVTVDEAYVRTLVYSEPVARNRLARWLGTSIPVARDFPADVVEAVRPWVALLPSDAPAITIAIDPDDPHWAQLPPDTVGFALSQISDAGAHIVSARLVFRSPAALREPAHLLHELGHALGLQHSGRLTDLMFPNNSRTTATLSADERVLLSMMYGRRRPGQVAPDNDQALGPAATGVIRTIVN